MEKGFGAEIVRRFGTPLRRMYTADELGLPRPIGEALERLKRIEKPIERDPTRSVAPGEEPRRNHRVLWRWGGH